MDRLSGLVCLTTMCLIAPMPALADDPTLDEQIREALALADYSLVDLSDLPADPSMGFQVTVPLGDVQQVLTLSPWSLRTQDFKVLVDDGTGVPVEMEAPAPRTCRGEVIGVQGGLVGGSLLDEGLKVMIILPGKDGPEQWFIQPLSEVVWGQPANLHVVYRGSDTMPLPYVCGVDDVGHDQHGDLGGDDGRVEIHKMCEIAIDADFQFYQLNGSSETNTINDVENIMAGVSLSYETDVDITYEITTILVRTSSGANPYTSNNNDTLLTQFQNWWNANQNAVQRDVAHLFTGREIDGSVIGTAFLGVICNRPSAYGFSQSRFTGSYSLRVTLTAHELGHNWNASHCDAQAVCRIMCSGVNGCDPVGNPPRFGPSEVTQITNFRNTRVCLTDVIVGLIELPFPDTFPGATFNTSLWPTVTGATITNGISPPSAPRVAQFDGTDVIESGEIGLLNPGGPVSVSLFTSRIGVESGESLILEMLDSLDNWVEVGRITSDGNNQITYSQSTFLLPGAVLYNGALLRIRAATSGADDLWFVDNFLMDVAPGYPLPIAHDFAGPLLDLGLWPVTSGNVVLTDEATNEPSEPNSIMLGLVGRLESAKFLAAGLAGQGYELSFSTQFRDLESGDFIIVYYTNSAGTFLPLTVIPSTGGTSTTFADHSIVLPADAFHNNLKIAFQNGGNAFNDTWFVDDVAIGIPVPPECPPDLSGSSDPNDPGYGVPDGTVDSADFFYFLDQFVAANLAVADLSGSSDPNDPAYGVPDGTVDSADFFYFLDQFVTPCP